ncbi:MAG: hypothetical protein R2712_17170 [Vicinamibacterales bacterium]
MLGALTGTERPAATVPTAVLSSIEELSDDEVERQLAERAGRRR